MIAAARLVVAGLVALLLLAACSAAVEGSAAPARIEFRPVLATGDVGQGGLQLRGADGVIYVLGPAELDGSHVASAEATNESGTWAVQVGLTPAGATAFADLSGRNVGKQLAIVVDGDLVSAPIIQAPITGGAVQISGDFDRTAATRLADRIMGR
ncbi:hypothetical protein PSU4_46370 [Pseudonocardia sulfidoxydans NBRC 16205]|uniref:SecDF P1 head subdomain domain-containing protein n=1 Tax=Pseudonocardia sulfidoxydans NBRC 16205 TaxID=1223511 RepID=A0A511DN43_9PSEU|nr:hypothetical protein [Pseudonocardia sulfidoxydans]GEL25683.1 hypothetical protein PSU4_46370 [Pseudonocardia sulfidoxydans NBRC 16205]